SAVDPAWLARPAEAALALGRGLRRLHDALPVEGCPFGWDTDVRSDDRPAAQALLGGRPPDDRRVVCQGDACAPNTLLADDGSVTGYVDLGRLGVADRWADLAPACWSADHNYGPGHADLVCEGYGVTPDRERLAWYSALWHADG
ncbi:phosphotransferase, partial [Aquipuribacter hungaricus]